MAVAACWAVQTGSSQGEQEFLEANDRSDLYRGIGAEPRTSRSAEKILGGRAFPAHSPEPGAGLGGEKCTQFCPCVRTPQDVGE